MTITIDIPEEFEIDAVDNFQEFFKRLECEVFYSMDRGTNRVCGKYELETIRMFIKSFYYGIYKR